MLLMLLKIVDGKYGKNGFEQMRNLKGWAREE